MAELKNVRIAYMATSEERDLLDELAELSGESYSSVLRRLVKAEARKELGWSPTKPTRRKKPKRKS